MNKTLAHAVVAWALIACFATSALGQLPAGSFAPDFSLRNLDDKTVRLSDFKSSPVVLVIGTTWCPGCRAQTSELEKTRAFLENHRIPVIDIFIQESAGTVRHYLKSKNLPATFEALLDDGQVHRNYRVYPIPRVLIVDESRRIIRDALGLDSKELTSILQQLFDRQVTPEIRDR